MRKSKLLAISILTLVGSLGLTLPVHSQCMVTMTYSYSFPDPFGPPGDAWMGVIKVLNASTCTLTMFNNGGDMIACQPGGTLLNSPIIGDMRPFGQFTAFAGTVGSPSCGWNCKLAGVDCGNFVIDGADGLPVELMEFSVE